MLRRLQILICKGTANLFRQLKRKNWKYRDYDRHNLNKVTQLILLLVIALLLGFAFKVTLKLSYKAERGQTFSREKNRFMKFTSNASECEVAKTLTICAHRASSLEFDGVKPGSLEAMRTLWKEGIRCYDMDIVQTSDEALVASHPDSIEKDLDKNALNSTQPLRNYISEISLQKLRQLGANSEDHPTLESMLTQFTKLYKNESKSLQSNKLLQLDSWQMGGQSQPVFCMELKGAAINQAAMEYVFGLVRKLRLKNLVVMWLATTPHTYALVSQIKSQDGIDFGAIQMDRKMSEDGSYVYYEPELNEEIGKKFQVFGPSIKLENNWFEIARKYRRPLATWVLDEQSQMFKSLQVKSSVGISNLPLKYRQFINQYIQDHCQTQQL